MDAFNDGFVVRLLPEQYFEAVGVPKAEFLKSDSAVRVGENAFVLYRTYTMLDRFPPLQGWQIRHLEKNRQLVTKRGENVVDRGHYVLRISTSSNDKGKVVEGAPQGLFAPEYANQETNYFCTCVLAWLIIHTVGSPYTTTQAEHLKLILAEANLLNDSQYD